MPVINGEAYWASVHVPNTVFDPRWTVDLFVSEEDGKVLEAAGLIPKVVKMTKTDNLSHPGKEIGDVFFNFKRKTTYTDGNPQKPPRVVDAHRNPIPADVEVGNGSIVNLAYRTYDYNFKGAAGVSTDLQGVQVLDLVEYEGNEATFEEAEGYVAEQPATPNDDDPFGA